MLQRSRTSVTAIVISLLGAAGVRGDVFVYLDEAGKTVTVEAQLVETTDPLMILELADGEYRVIPSAAVEKREAKEGPMPLDAGAIAAQLETRFGKELFRSLVREPYVIGLVLGAPLNKGGEGRAKGFLTRAAAFLKNVDNAFVGFLKEMKIPSQAAARPLVVLIFETEEGFVDYARTPISGPGLAAENLSGFYSKLSNYLAIRLAECRSFDVPLHEAIHQLVYNRGVFRRLAPIPAWFDEGIATGFEGNQGKVSIGPTRISPRYARQALAAERLTFEKMLTDDLAFKGNVLAGEAYGGAWGLHWLAVTKYRAQYGKYVRLLAEKQPLAKEDPNQRLVDFREAFGKGLDEIDKEFRPLLDSGIKKQKVVLNPERPAGYSFTQQNVGEVELSAINRIDAAGNGRLEVQGKLTNVSPLRPMAFYVSVETDAGTYCDWYVPLLDMQKSTTLELKYAVKQAPGSRGGPSRSFITRIRSTPSDSSTAEAWTSGHLPVPGGGR